ncbi:MAG: restriction endonuclease subunit S [Candidatus Sericytochromatia bacterium]
MQQKIQLQNLDKSNWKSFRFDQIAKNISERVEPQNTDLDLYIGLEHLDAESLHIKRHGHKSDVAGTKLKCYPGDVIFGKRRAYQRKAAVVTQAGICSAHAFVLRANPEVIDPQLFPFFLHSDQFVHRAVDISAGGLSPTINWGVLKIQEFLLPPKDQQAELAELLWAMDGVIEGELNILNSTQILLESTLRDYFTKNHAEKTILEKVGLWKSGGTPSRSEKKFWDGNIPWVSPKDMKFEYIYESQEQISDLAVKSGADLLPINSILLVVRGLILAHSFPVGLTRVPVAFNQDMKAIIVCDEYLPEFVLFFLQHIKDLVVGLATTTTHGTKRLATQTLFQIEIPKPTLDEQHHFSFKINRIKDVFRFSQSKIAASKVLQKSLINQIF